MVLKEKLIPTYYGYIGSTNDALLIIQAILNNQLLAVPRRPHDKERSSLIQSGNIFVFVEERSGIKRWTDGIAWSPSRILGRFLVYRELDKAALSDSQGLKDGDEKKKRRKKDSSSDDMSMPIPYENSTSPYSQQQQAAVGNSVTNRALVGSLVASYAFKDRGLIKKTLSVTINPNTSACETIHVVGYYNADDVINGKLRRPSDSSSLKDLKISVQLYNALRESNLGSKNSLDDENFYFFDANNNVISIPNPQPPTTSTASSFNSSSIAQQQQQIPPPPLHDMYHNSTSTNTNNNTNNVNNNNTSSSVHLVSSSAPPSSALNAPPSQDQYAYPRQASIPQYWPQQQQQQAAAAQQQAQAAQAQYYYNPAQPREDSFSSVTSAKRTSPPVDGGFPYNSIGGSGSNSNSISGASTMAQQAQQPQQASSAYPNQVPKFFQPQYQYLPQQLQQLQQAQQAQQQYFPQYMYPQLQQFQQQQAQQPAQVAQQSTQSQPQAQPYAPYQGSMQPPVYGHYQHQSTASVSSQDPSQQAHSSTMGLPLLSDPHLLAHSSHLPQAAAVHRDVSTKAASTTPAPVVSATTGTTTGEASAARSAFTYDV